MKMSEREHKYRDFIEAGINKDKALEYAIKLSAKNTYYEKYPLILKKERKKQTGKWYVTRYEKYPIYEPAEGGYCYDGYGVDEVHEFETRKKAMSYLRKCLKKSYDIKNEYSWISSNKITFGCDSEYVGIGFFYSLERMPGIQAQGKVHYS